MSKSLLTLILSLFFANLSRAEQPIFNIGSTNANPGEIIEINFLVDNFTNIISAQYSVNWNPDVLEFKSVKNFNPSVNGLSPSNFNVTQFVNEGKFTFTWFESSLNPITIPDGSLFYTVEFEVVGVPCQNSAVSITNDPLEIEVAEDGEVPVGLVANNGMVTIPGSGCVEGINIIGNTVLGACGGESCIRFTVENFTTVGSIEFSLIYNPAILQFDRFQNFAPLLAFGEGNTNLLSPGTLRVLWFNGNAENDTLADGTTLFEICFDVIGTGGQSSQITFGNNPSPMISDIDGNFHTVTIQPAVITAQCQLEGFALIADTICDQPGQLFCIPIKVNDFDDIIALQFSINWDPTRFEFDHVEGFNLPGLDAGGFGTPGNPDVQEGELTISWIDLSLTGVTVPDLSSIFTLCLRAVGPAGSSSPITFSENPLEIEIATLDSVLVYGLVPGVAQIRQNCDTPPCVFSYTLAVTNPSCAGSSDGALDLNVDLGSCTGMPTYQWSFGGATSQDISGVPAGTYSVTITVGTQVVVATDMVVDPSAISVTGTITNPSPPGSSNGSVTLNVSGGTPNYSFMWSDSSTNQNLLNVAAGSYTVIVTDSRGCTFSPDPFIVGADVTGSVSNVTCEGLCNGSITATASFGASPYTYVWNTNPVQTTATINNLCAGMYCVTITDSGGSTRNMCFTVTQPSALVVSATIAHDLNENGQGAIDLNVTGGTPPYFYSWSNGAISQDLINLSAGEYCVTISYGLNCTFDTCFTVFAGGIGLSLVTSQFGNFQTSCNNICDGEINLVVSGGTQPFTYLWSNNAVTPNLTNLCPGIYSVTITDASGSTASGTRTITAPPELTFTTINTNPSDITASDGAISIIANGGAPPYTYQWVGGNFAAANNLASGTYPITIIDDNGCQVTRVITLIPIGVPCNQAITVITPNSDGFNDFFTISCVFNVENRLFIYNRQGGLVYETRNYTNTWTGVDNDNQPLPDGGYMWVLEINPQTTATQVLKGTVNILRTAD